MTLYLHIPFCTSKCGYCAFNSSAQYDSLVQQQYTLALIADITAQLQNHSYQLSSIYIGGGTPNTLASRHYAKIFECINLYASLEADCEITIEANPNLISLEWMSDLKSFGINRVSLGVQSFNDAKLQFLQRDHQSYDIQSSITAIRKAQIQNISLDLIYGTPFDDEQFLLQELTQLQSFDLYHLSAYTLSIDKGSAFYKNPPSLPNNDHSLYLRHILHDFNFTQYEVSNFFCKAKSKHNLAYWQGLDYLGCGAGGVGCIDGTRMQGSNNIHTYIKNPTHKQKEFLTPQDQRLERLFLGLRCEVGVDLADLDSQKISYLLEENKCHINHNRLVANDYFLADEIALFLS
ncbi:hypothetical protein BBW65_02770 [Helicobacter enhydrae]|uniref:Heme chaperone HemW n=1 Tax=Helicobacter enhydrae TaxID=222136 RepID=A0A1B1U4V9_9HELI|nr:radical SAM family heme chaperone HemW [Helicobacter enhydrae]ANV97790.1 hypothetical protein BBW65_02770 [Helicobacter enhydrae]